MTTRLNQLRGSVALLASSADDQVEHLRQVFVGEDVSHGFNVDELALEFSDAYSSIELMCHEGEITSTQRNAVVDLNRILTEASAGRPHQFWTVDSLRKDPHWDEIRAKAGDCLSILNSNYLGTQI